MKSIISIIYCSVFSMSLGIVPLTAYSFNLMGVQEYKSTRLNETVSIKTGVFYLNHYHRQFEQSLYSFDLKGNKKISSKANFIFNGFGLLKVEGEGASSYSLSEIYYLNQFSSKLEYSIGRKIINWSELEQYLPSGFWNNVWDFNKVSPLKEGLVGIFLNYKASDKSKIEFFISPVSIPKMTSHYKFDSTGKVKANTLWVKPLSKSINYKGDQYKAKYFLDLNISRLVAQPQIGGSFNWSDKKTFLKASYFYGPSKDIDTAVDFSWDVTTPESHIEVFILPKRVNVYKGTVEFGKYWNESSKMIFSTSYRQRAKKLPTTIDDKKSYIGTSSGGIYQLSYEQFFKAKSVRTRVHVVENTAIQNLTSGELGEFLLSSPSASFQYRRGIGGSIDYKTGPRFKVHFQGYYDIKLKGVMGNFNINMNWGKAHLTLGYNFIEAISFQTEAFYKDFRENDSYHMGVSYVF